MEKTKQESIEQLYFLRACISKISQNHDKIEAAEDLMKSDLKNRGVFNNPQKVKQRLLEKRSEKEKSSEIIDDNIAYEELYSEFDEDFESLNTISSKAKAVQKTLEREDNKISLSKSRIKNINEELGRLNDVKKNKVSDIFVYLFLIAVTVIASFFLFRWWVNTDAAESLWAKIGTGFLAFSLSAVFLVFDIGNIACICECMKKSKEAKTAPAKIEKLEKDKSKHQLIIDAYNAENSEANQLHTELSDIGAEFVEVKKSVIDKLKEKRRALIHDSLDIVSQCRVVSIVDERDWCNLDVIIYELETGRADGIKEALQQADLYIRHEEIKDVMLMATDVICHTIKDSISRLSYSIETQLSNLSTEVSQLTEAQNKIVGGVSGILESQELNNALLKKANVSSEKLADDVQHIRMLKDYAYHGIR